MAAVETIQAERPLNIHGVLKELVEDGILSDDESKLVLAKFNARPQEKLTVHPLNFIASLNLASQQGGLSAPQSKIFK